MASIEKRVRDGRVSYRARYRDPSGRQRVKTFGRKIDAEKYLALIEAAKLPISVPVRRPSGRW